MMVQQQQIAWNVMTDDGWNPRSLSSFQTFPRHPSPSTSSNSSSSSSSSSAASENSSSGSSSPPAIPSHQHSHSKSLIEETVKWDTSIGVGVSITAAEGKSSNNNKGTTIVPPAHRGHSRSLGQATDFIRRPEMTAHRQSSLNAEVVDPDVVEVTLGPNDRRFGFSVVGGKEEGFPPRIDEIAKGSPADKADLEIGDEILEVNGKSLDGATHTEVISHIHQCIRSRTICLRVKRKSGNKLAQDLAANSNVQDAFVIAVEKQARERLERLSALKKIKPVDMTKLSEQLSQDGQLRPNSRGAAGGAPEDDLDGDEEELEDGASSTRSRSASKTPPTSRREGSAGAVRVSVPGAATTPTQQPPPPGLLSPTGGQHPSVISPFGSPSTWLSNKSEGEKDGGAVKATTGSTPSSSVRINGDHVTQVRVDALVLQPDHLHQDRDQSELIVSPRSGGSKDHITAVQVEHTTTSSSSSTTPASSHPPLKLGKSASSGSRENVNRDPAGQWVVNSSSSSSELEREQQQQPAGGLASVSTVPTSASSSSSTNMGAMNGNPSMRSSTGAGSSRGTSGRSVGGGSTSQSSDGGMSSSHVHHHHLHHNDWNDAGPHREMAVDVPDTFVGRTKTPPRYPPPKPTPAPIIAANTTTTTQTTTTTAASSTTTAPLQPQNNNTSPGLRKKVVTAQAQSAAAAAAAAAASKPAPPPRDHLRIEEDGRLVVLNQPPQLPNRLTGEPDSRVGVEVDMPTAEQMERIRKYQEDERRRREKEERIAREEEFLRSSLRGSRKLQALEETSTKVLPSSGVVNIAYTGRDEDEDDEEDQQQTMAANTAGLASWASALAQQNNYLLNGGMQKIIGLQDVTAALQRVQQQLKKNGHAGQGVEADLAAVQSLLLSPAFRSALTIHSKVQEVWCCGQPVLPAHLNAQQLVSECLTGLQQGQCGSWPEAVELVSLLSRYEVEGLLYAHDRIAEASTISTAPLSGGHHEVPDITNHHQLQQQQQQHHHHQHQHSTSVDYGMPESSFVSSTTISGHSPAHSAHSAHSSQPSDRTFKIIRLEKSNEPLGATVRNDGESVVVGRIVRGGVAERSGLLHEGDEILEVNGVEVRGKSINDVCDLVGSMTGTITFLIVPVGAGQVPAKTAPGTGIGGGGGGIMPANPVVHLKAHFDYDPEDDLYIPCKELGISFMKGDILHVISQDDPNWWQAFREGEEDQTLAGLIPSRSFQQQREAVKQAVLIDTMENEITSSRTGKAGTLLCARKQHKKKKRASFRSNFGKDENEEILTYEEVGLYYPRANHKRPIVLIGPPNIGRKELREMLMQDSERFAPAIPHTSRTKKDSEVNGQDYHFISRVQFEADIVNRRFVEHGEYEKSYYGTTLDAIRAVVLASKFCVLNLHPQSLKILKESDLMPFVVFVAPPSLEKLRAKKRDKGEAIKDDDLKEIIEKAREMEEVYGHYFDMVIVNGDEERTYGQLVNEVNRLEREPQWVPATWLDRNDHK